MADPQPSFLDAASPEFLEREALRSFLLRQRWFGGKARNIASVRFHDVITVATGAHPLFLTLVTVTYEDGPPELYQIPLTIVTRAGSPTVAADAMLAPARHVPDGFICDAVWSDDAVRAIVRILETGGELVSQRGRLVATVDRAASQDGTEQKAEIGRLPAVHSNSALTVAGRYLLKLFRRVERGLNPDVEIGRFLARTNARVNTPTLVGSIEYRTADGQDATLALLQTLVPSKANAWEAALAQLEAFLLRAQREPTPPDATRVRALLAGYADAMALLGRRTAELHVALCAASGEADFEPERTSDEELVAYAQQDERHAIGALRLLDERHASFDEDARLLARRLLDRRPIVLDRLRSLWSVIVPFVKIRVHGDYHLGQVLCVGEDFVIIDFEGEPARPVAERRAKQSPLRDVAGMIRSLSYAADMGLRTATRAGMRGPLAPWARGWQACTSAAFLEGYRAASAAAAFMPAAPDQFHHLLEVFTLSKALYELQYEMNNRPMWASTPLRGLLQILDADSFT
jgi:trehalose synthase-fused probable maltokinase